MQSLSSQQFSALFPLCFQWDLNIFGKCKFMGKDRKMRPRCVNFLRHLRRDHSQQLLAAVAKGMFCETHPRCPGWLQAAHKGRAMLFRAVACVQTDGRQ